MRWSSCSSATAPRPERQLGGEVAAPARLKSNTETIEALEFLPHEDPVVERGAAQTGELAWPADHDRHLQGAGRRKGPPAPGQPGGGPPGGPLRPRRPGEGG